MDHPEICGKHRFNNAKTQTKDAINRKQNYGTLAFATDLNDPKQKMESISTVAI